ncbi:MAG: zinc ABC transporter substrate-binding protein [Thermodesulfobacteriota bacterium]
MEATGLLKRRFSVFGFRFSVRDKAISPKFSRFICSLAISGLCWLLLPGIAWGGAPAGKIPVAATILPLADFCRHLGGEQVEVQVLVPPGASPHVFEPPPSVMARAARARVFVYTGAGLEPWAEKLLRSLRPGNLEVVEAVRGLHLLRDVDNDQHGEAEHGKHEGHDHHHAGGNPHVWLDPVLAQSICRQIAAALMKVDPEHRAAYEAHLQSYLKELEALHQEITRRVSGWRQKDFVCFHPAYTYFAKRYGLRQVGVIELSPGREPTPRHLQEIVAAIKKFGIKVVFAEPQLNPRVAEVIAREAGAKVLLLDPMGGRPPYGDDYLKLMRYNLAILEEAMK